MKLVLFGATGATGQHIVEQSLEAGHQVTAVARRPEAITLRHERLTVIYGDVLEKDTLNQVISQQDVVISTIGVTVNKPTTLYSTGITNIIEGMYGATVNRLICISAAGLEVGSGVPLWQRIVIPLMLHRLFRHVYADMARMEAVVRSSTLDWTIIRAPRLTNGPRRGKYRIALNQHLTQVGVSRADVADYIHTHLNDPATYRMQVEIAY